MNEPLQSTTTVAGTPSGVLEPVAQLLEKRGPVRRRLNIISYVCKCIKCQATVAVAQEVCRELGAEKAIKVSKRPWLFWWFLPLWKGATHPPILEIAGRVYSEGVVPEKEVLKNHIRSLLV